MCCLGLYLLGYFHLHTFLVVIACTYVFLSLAIDTETARKIQLVLWPYKVPLPTSAEDWIQMAASGPDAGRKPGVVINSFFTSHKAGQHVLLVQGGAGAGDV